VNGLLHVLVAVISKLFQEWFWQKQQQQINQRNRPSGTTAHFRTAFRPIVRLWFLRCSITPLSPPTLFLCSRNGA
jgi:hypothetical protein